MTYDQTKLEYVGSVFTDVSSLLIADPCKTLACEGTNPPTYEDLISKWELQPAVKPISPVVKLHDDAAVVRFGTDGYCHIFVERGKSGSIETIVIKPGMCAKEPK